MYTRNLRAQSSREKDNSCVEMERKEKLIRNKLQTDYFQKLENMVRAFSFLMFEEKDDDAEHHKKGCNLLYDSHSKKDVDRVLMTIAFKSRNQSTDVVVNPLTHLCERTDEYAVIDTQSSEDKEYNLELNDQCS